MRVRHHDLIVIGSGSGNSFLDARFEDLDVALVEHGTFGGTCLNVGCIPTKMLVYPADVARSVVRAGHLGIDATVDKVRWTDIRDRVFGRIDPISHAGRDYRANRCRNITLYEGHARFTGPRQVHVLLIGSDRPRPVTAYTVHVVPRPGPTEQVTAVLTRTLLPPFSPLQEAALWSRLVRRDRLGQHEDHSLVFYHQNFCQLSP